MNYEAITFFPLDGIDARYLAVRTLGDSLYPDKNLYAAAGSYDLKVYGDSSLIR